MKQPPMSPAPRPRGGVSLIEILFATLVLAFAMIPVFGLMTGGLIQTDVNVGFTNSVEIATGLMNHLLSEETSLTSLPLSEATDAYPQRNDPFGPATGNVAADPALDRFFPAPEWSVNGTAQTRDVRINGITYHVWIWIAAYDAAGDLQFGYYENPEIDFRLSGIDGSTQNLSNWFDELKTLRTTEYAAGFAPWSAGNVGPEPDRVYSPSTPETKITSFPWGRVEAVRDQEDLSEPAPGGGFLDFAKIVIRVSWGEDQRRGRGREKDFWLVSFKADLQE